MPKNNAEEKPKRLYFKSYLAVVKNAVGSEMFRNFYATTPSRGEFDAFSDGDYSCAFFVSSILLIFGKLKAFHGLVEHTQKDLLESGWQEVDKPKPGDIVVWEPIEFREGPMRHIGFAVGSHRAVSTSWRHKKVVEHAIDFDGKRKIEAIYRCLDWEPHDA